MTDVNSVLKCKFRSYCEKPISLCETNRHILWRNHNSNPRLGGTNTTHNKNIHRVYQDLSSCLRNCLKEVLTFITKDVISGDIRVFPILILDLAELDELDYSFNPSCASRPFRT